MQVAEVEPRDMQTTRRRRAPQTEIDSLTHHSQKRCTGKNSGPRTHGWSAEIDETRVREARERGENESSSFSLSTREQSLRQTDDSDSFEVSEERESDPTSISDSPSPGSSLTDLTLVTRQQSADLLAAHLRWGHRSFRSCARVLGIPSTVLCCLCRGQGL